MGYFPVSRGIRQGDPLSPLLFALVEDTLSRSITKLRVDGILKPMVSYRRVPGPSHLFFIDDIMAFAKGEIRGLQRLAQLLKTYNTASGQIMNKDKSCSFLGGMHLLGREES